MPGERQDSDTTSKGKEQFVPVGGAAEELSTIVAEIRKLRKKKDDSGE